MGSFTGNQSFILGTLLPLLTKDIIYGGSRPYIAYVNSAVDLDEAESDNIKHVSYSCADWTDTHLSDQYPTYITDFLLVIDCLHLNSSVILEKVYSSLETKYIGPLAKPSISVLVLRQDISSITLEVPLRNIDYLVFVAAEIKTKGNGTQICTKVSPVHDSAFSTKSRLKEICFSQDKVPAIDDFINKSFGGFHGKLFHITSADYTPFTTIDRTKEGKIFDGYTIEILRAFAEKFNFRYDLEEEEDYGGLDQNGNWIGMVGLVSRYEKDMVFAGLTITSQRETVVDFSVPFWYETSSVAVHVASRDFFYLFNPFTTEVWGTMVGMLGLAILTFTLIDLVTTRIANQHQPKKLTFNTDATFTAVCVFFMQSTKFSSTSVSLRVVVSALSLGLVIISSTYSGNLIASLTVQDIQLPFKTLEELAENDMFTILLKPYSSHHTLLEESRSGVYARLWQKIEKKKSESFCESGDVCFERLMSAPNKYVKVDDYTRQVKKYVPQSDCKVTILPELFFPAGFGIALPERSPYKVFFDEGYVAS